MKVLHVVILCLISLLLAAAPALAQDKDIQRIAGEMEKIVTQEGLTDMMSVTSRLKEAGGSYQQDLTYPLDAKLEGNPGAMRILIGVYQFDALYAAAFGKKKEVTQFLKSQEAQMLKLNLKGQVDVSAVFPPELNWMVREPDKVNFKDIVAAYADNLPRYEKLGEDPAGLVVIGDALYGFVVEGLYVIGQSVLQADNDPQMVRVINGMAPSLKTLTRLYEGMRNDEKYAAAMDPAQVLGQGARAGWISELADMLVRKDGVLTGQELASIASFAVEQRQTIGLASQ